MWSQNELCLISSILMLIRLVLFASICLNFRIMLCEHKNMYSTVVDHEIKFPLYVNSKVIMTFILLNQHLPVSLLAMLFGLIFLLPKGNSSTISSSKILIIIFFSDFFPKVLISFNLEGKLADLECWVRSFFFFFLIL